jgi:hypothetical protein
MIGDRYGKETTVEHDHAADPFDVKSRVKRREDIRDVMTSVLFRQPDSVLIYIDRGSQK